MDPGRHPRLYPVRLGDQAGEDLLVHVRAQQRAGAAQALGVDPLGVVRGGLADDVHGHHQAGLVRLADRDGAQPHRAVGREVDGLLAVQDGLQQVDGREVGEARDDGLDQLLGGALEVERGADPGGGLGDHGEPLLGAGGPGLGLEALGDVDDGRADAEHPAGGVLQPEVGGRPRAVTAGVTGGAAVRAGVDHRPAGGQHPAHHLFDVGAVEARQDGADPPAQVVGDGQAVDPGEGLVQPDVAQVGVVDRQADRGLAEEAVQDRDVLLDVPQGPDLGGGGEQQRRTARTGDRIGAELQVDDVAVAVAQREHAGPALPGHDPFEQAGDLGALAGVDQQPCRVVADGLLCAVAEQGLRVLAPVQDQAVALEECGGEGDQPVAVEACGSGARRLTAGVVRSVPLESAHESGNPPVAAWPAGRWGARPGCPLKRARSPAPRRPLRAASGSLRGPGGSPARPGPPARSPPDGGIPGPDGASGPRGRAAAARSGGSGRSAAAGRGSGRSAGRARVRAPVQSAGPAGRWAPVARGAAWPGGRRCGTLACGQESDER